MADKINTTIISSGYASTAPLNQNFDKISDELNNKVLYRDTSEPNQMENDLDMNSNRIINLPVGVGSGEPVTVGQINLGTSDSQSAIDAGASAAAALVSQQEIERVHLGFFAVAPTLDNEGNTILEGAIYYNTVDHLTYVRDSSGIWRVFSSVENGWKPIIPTYWSGLLLDAVTLVQFIAPQTFVLPAGMPDSFAIASTAATAETILTINKNDSAVGTITFAIAGTVGAFVVASPVSLVAGDKLTVVNQGTADITLADVSITLRTEQIVGGVLSKYAADFYVDTGTPSAHILSPTGLTVSPGAYDEGLRIAYKANASNVGTVTINVDGLGTVALTIDNVPLSGGELTQGRLIEARYSVVDDNFYIVNFTNTPTIDQVYKIGDVYITTLILDPSVIHGYGTWSPFGEGRVLIGEGTGNDGTDVTIFAGAATGGEYNHTLTEDEMPSHVHNIAGLQTGDNGPVINIDNDGGTPQNQDTDATGGDMSHNNIPPFIVVQMWLRVT